MTHEILELEKFFAEVSKKFKAVAYVPGNHDLWLVKGDKSAKNSILKYERIMELCAKHGIRTAATKVKDEKSGDEVWLVPLHSWYNESFDDDESTKGERIRREVWCDFMYCKWPEEVINEDSESPAAPNGTPENFFLEKNELSIKAVLDASSETKATIITFSHFLPRRELYPPTSSLSEHSKYLPRVMGTEKLEKQLRAVGSNIHLFGHTHLAWNQVIDNVHYIQMCLMHAKERRNRPQDAFSSLEEMCIYDSSIKRGDMQPIIESRKASRIAALQEAQK